MVAVKPTDQLGYVKIMSSPYFYNQLVRSSSTRYLSSLTGLLNENDMVLDVGCGASAIIQGEFNVTRCDLNAGNIPDVVCNALNLSFSRESFDAVIHSWVLEHIEEPRVAIDECYRVLKPGGLLYLTTNMAWHLHEKPRDYYRFTEFGLRYLFCETTWEVVSINATLGFWGTICQLVAYRIVSVLNRFKVEFIHPLITVPLQLFGLFSERFFLDTSLCAGYCIIVRKKT